MRSNLSSRTAAAVGILAVLATAGCGGSSDESSSTPKVDTSVLGTKDSAKGDPLRIGFVSSGKSAAADTTGEVVGAKAAADYINDYLGGIGGRPVELTVCEDGFTAAGATKCANQMLSDEVPVVLLGASAQGGVVRSALVGNGPTVISDQAIDPTAFDPRPGNYILTNAVSAAFGIAAQTDSDAGVNHAAYVVNDVPAATEGVNTVGKGYFGVAGVDLDVIAVPVGAPDVTPQIQAAISDGVEAFHVVADSNLCTQTFKALQQLAFDGPITGITQCFPDTPGAGLPQGASGLTLLATGGSFTPASADPAVEKDFSLYETVMGTYAPGSSTAGLAPIGYRVVMSLATVLATSDDDLTSDGVNAAFSGMSDTPLPMGAGLSFNCDGTAYSLSPTFCTGDALEAPLEKDGTIAAYKPVKVTLELPSAS